jgi:hypothetical protein
MRTYHHRRPYGTGITWKRPHASGAVSSDPAELRAIAKLAKRDDLNPKTVAK